MYYKSQKISFVTPREKTFLAWTVNLEMPQWGIPFNRYIGANEVQKPFYISIFLISLKYYVLCKTVFKKIQHRKAGVQRYVYEGGEHKFSSLHHQHFSFFHNVHTSSVSIRLQGHSISCRNTCSQIGVAAWVRRKQPAWSRTVVLIAMAALRGWKQTHLEI